MEAQQRWGLTSPHRALLQLGGAGREAGGRRHQLGASVEARVVHLFPPMGSIHCRVFIAGFIVAIGKNEALSSWVESIRDR